MPRCFRLFGRGLVFSGIFLGLWDVVCWILFGSFSIPDIGSLWYRFHAESLLLLEPAVSRYAHPYLWDPIILEILIAPTGLVLFLFGILIIYMTKIVSRKDVKRRFSS
jgi:hypothetical protein